MFLHPIRFFLDILAWGSLNLDREGVGTVCDPENLKIEMEALRDTLVLADWLSGVASASPHSSSGPHPEAREDMRISCPERGPVSYFIFSSGF